MTDVTIKSYRKEREKEILDGLQKGLEKVGLIVERQAKINVSQSPPSHPQVQTGRLRSSITHVVGDGEVEIGSNVEYSKYLELGTSHNPPYPWLFPAVELKKPEIIEALKNSTGMEVTLE
jgi:hypothetical protein